MAKPWEIDWTRQQAPQGGVFTLPPSPQQAEQQKREAERLGMEQAREARAAAEWNASHNPDGSPKADIPPAPGDATKTGDEYLATLDPALGAQVKALAEGRRAFPTGAALRSPQVQELVAAAAQYDPTLDAANASTRVATRKDFTSGKAAQNITSLNTVLGHLGELWTAAQDLHNRSFTPWNTVANAAESTMGDPAIRNFDLARQAAVSEMERAFRGGGGSEKDIEAWKEALSSSSSPDQFRASMGTAVSLLNSRLAALGDQYKNGMSRSADPISFLNPHAQDVFTALSPGGDGMIHHGHDQSAPVIGGGTSGPPSIGGGGSPGGPGGPGGPKPLTPWDQRVNGMQAATGATRNEFDPETAAGIDALVRAGRPVSEAIAFARSRNFSSPDPASYNAAVAYQRQHPDYHGGYTDALRNVPQSLREQAAGSQGGAYASGATSALTAGMDDELAGVGSALVGGGYSQGRDAYNAKKAILSDTHPGASLAGNMTGGLVGSLIGGAALARLAPKLGAAAQSAFGGAAPAVGDAGYGAIYGAGENNDDRVLGAMGGAASGVAGGVAGRSLARGVGNVVAPPAGQWGPAYAQGVFPTLGQRLSTSQFMGGVLGKIANTSEQALQSFPALGALVARARQIPRDQFQRGAFNEALNEIGQQLPDNMVPGNDPHVFVSQAFGKQYDAARRGMQFTPDKQYMGDLGQFINKLDSGVLSGPQADQVKQFLTNTVASRLHAGQGALNGEAYQQAGTEMNKAADAWGRDSSTQPMASALSDYQTIFDNAARRNSDPAAVSALDAADAGWAKYARIRNAASRGGVRKEDGTFSPTDLLAAVKQEGGGIRSAPYLRGDALMQDYANAGRGLIDTLPNSGTADRLFTGQAIAGGAGTIAGAPAALAANPGALGVFAPYLPGMNKAVTRAIAPRDATLSPDVAAILEDMSRQFHNRTSLFGRIGAPAAVGYFSGQ